MYVCVCVFVFWLDILAIIDWKKDSLQLSPNYCTISLISHPIKVILKIILNRPKSETEKISTEEQIVFHLGLSTWGQYLTSEYCVRGTSNYIYHTFIDFKKAFERVLHAALWTTIMLNSINTSLIDMIKNLYVKVTIAVCLNGSTGEWFRTTFRVRQSCQLSPTLSIYI